MSNPDGSSQRLACYATVPFQLRALEPIARAFPESLISLDPEEIKAWQPDAIVVTAEHEVTLFRPFCTEHNVALIALRHGAGNKYTAPCREYTLADYICGSEWDQQDFRRGGIVPLRQFLLTGNPWVDETFRLPPHTLNRECPTILFAPTWNPQTSAAALLEGKLVPLVRRVFPRSRIVIRPHPNIICHDHPYMQRFSTLFQRWMDDWRRAVAGTPDVELIDDKQLSISKLFADADILISDGSSLIYEFIALDRPILLYSSSGTPDYGQIDPLALANRCRDIGLEFHTDEELVSALGNAFDHHTSVCSARQNQLTQELFGRYRDGHSTDRVIEAIRSILSTPRPKPVASSGSGDPVLRRAEEYLAKDDVAGARRCLIEGLASDPHCVGLVAGFASFLIRMKDLHFARIELDLALQLDPQFAPALEALAGLCIEQNRLDEAAAALRRLAAVQPDNPNMQKALAVVDQALAEAAKAATCPPPEHDDRHERVACPLCGSTEAGPYRAAADIVKCRQCNAVYLRTRLNAVELDRLYQTYVDDGSHLKLPLDLAQASASRWKRDYFLNEIMEIDGTRGPMLDVGCSWGAFLLGAREQGFTPMGIEITRKAVRFANKTLGIPVVNTQFLDTPIPAAALQIITMVHVLEHLPQPKQALARAFDILKPGGLFCGIVPNIESFSSQLQRDTWYWLDPNYHYVHYSPATLRRHLEAAGFVVERLYTTRGDFDPKKIHDLVPELDDAAFAQLLKDLAESGRGEEIRFFARKPAHVPATISENFTLPLQQLDWPAGLDPYIQKQDGKFVYLNDTLLEPERLRAALETVEPFYFHCGGAGDALLLLATFYDAHPDSVVVSYPNSQAAMRSFFDAFPALKRVYFLPQHSRLHVNELVRRVVPQLPNFRGMGVTPCKDYAAEWGEQLDIFRNYGVVARPEWAKRHPEAGAGKRVAVAAQGSLVGMAGTKRNVIESRDWLPLLDFLKQQGWHPMIVGTPNERKAYPCPEGCDDQRSYSFRDQMDQMAGCALFVGADSWAKTYAALTGMPTYVFDAIKGGDWKGVKDASDFIFLDPWDCLQVVSGLEALKDCLTRQARQIHTTDSPPESSMRTVHVAWEGTFTDNGSLSHVNRELTRALAGQSRVEVTRVGKGHRDHAPTRTEVTVRHAWPPDWQQPKYGHWVLIQPWEYGALPLDWVSKLDGVAEIWVPSEHVRRVYVDSGVPPAKVHVVPNGIDPERFRPGAAPCKLGTAKSFKFLFVGGTIHRKGPDLLLKAFTENFTAADDVCLVIKDFGGESVYAGQTLREQIQAVQARPDAPEILYLTDELAADAMPGLYTSCDCLVHPYRGEGFALPVLEAMACGLPVVVTAGGATDDFATGDCAYLISAHRQRIGYRVGPFTLARPGWLLEPSFAELKERMRWVFEHRDEARAKGQQASEVVRRDWTWDRAAEVAAQRLRILAAREQCSSVPKPLAIELPSVARLGDLATAHQLFREKRFREAWDAAIEATKVRPFHPEAHDLCKRIKKVAGAAVPSVPKPAETPRLTVCLIVKNEEKFLAGCLQSVREVASQIVVVDTGSTDGTKEIARQHGAELYDFQWNDDFSAARNAALEHARGDWVLVLDADEELTVDGRAVLQQEMRAGKVLAYRLPIVDIGREEEGCSYVPRLFRNAPGLFYIGRIHEQVFSSVEVRRKQWGMENKLSAATLIHHGYKAEVSAERNKLARNLRLLEQALKEMPNEPNLLMNYGLELARAGRQEMAVERYVEAFRFLQAMPPERVVPELRESLVTQLCAQLTAAKRFDEVVRVMHTPLVQRDGLTASMHFGLGLAYMQLRRFPEAAEQFRQCLAKRDKPSLTPVNRDIRKAGPHHCLAICLKEMKQLDAADKEFQQALAMDPQSNSVRFDYAAFRHGRGQSVDALKSLYQLAKEKPDALPVWLLGGHIALSDPQFLVFAREWTAEAIKQFPQDQLVSLHRAEALLLSGQTREALPLWQRAGAPSNPAHRAAQILCQLASEGQIGVKVPPQDETAVSKEFIRWYQRLLGAGPTTVLTKVTERIDLLTEVLPTAGRTLASAVTAVEPALC